jgi:3-hydroxyisobutyrate dehydrogenase
MKEQHGVAWIDAPVSGGPAAAHSGTMTILVGGEAEAFASVRPVLDDLGRNITHLGPSGSGQIAKIVNQAIVGVGYMLMAEAVALAEAAGLDASRVPACLAGGMADSTVLQRVFPQMQQRDFAPPRAYARQLAKDQKSVLAFAAKLGLDLPVVNGAAQRFVDYAEAGNAMQDPATILRLYTAQTAWRS